MAALLMLVLPLVPAAAASTAWDTHLHGAARLITATEATGSATRLDIGLQLRLTPGWHTYWRTPGDAGFPPSIDWKGSDNLAKAVIAWPAPRRLAPAGDLETIGYVNGVVLPITVTLAHPGEALRLHAEVDYASCKEVCIPYHASLNLVLPPGLARPGPEAPLVAAAEARVPGDGRSAGLKLVDATVVPDGKNAILALRVASMGAPLRDPDVFVEGAGDASPGRPDIALIDHDRLAIVRVPIRRAKAASLVGRPLQLTFVDGGHAAQFAAAPTPGIRSPLPDTARSRLAILGLALLGGLILNLMPCVLPVLSLKLLALVGYASEERRRARLGLLATSAGIVACFAILAGTLIGLKAAGAAVGWGIQFQSPWFLAAMALATTLFAASLWDWLPIALPGGMAGAVGGIRGRGPMRDAFLIGAFATLLAASCSAPFLGTAIGFALARGPGDIAIVFAALSLGMAAPFLAVAAAPALVAWLPRPGRWMVWLRRVLGLALLGTATWLLSVLALEINPGAALAAGGTLVALLAVLAWRQYRPPPRHSSGWIAAALAIATVAVVPAVQDRAAPHVPAPSASARLWRPFNPATLKAAISSGRLVFVNVTAAWCLTCKVNELTVLERSPVADRLREPGVVALRADWTRPDPVVTAYLQSFGRYGVPLYVVYGPAAPQGIALPELLTSAAVTNALRRAEQPSVPDTLR